MAHCVISGVLDTDTGLMEPSCVVHCHVAPCPLNGEPAEETELHSWDDCDGARDAAIKAWEIRTHRQRPFVLHHGGPGDEPEHNLTSPGCWCGPELLPAVPTYPPRSELMIEVRIRNADYAESIHLCEWPADKLDNVIPTVQAWGVMDQDGEAAYGQFVVDHDKNAAYFEIVIGDDE